MNAALKILLVDDHPILRQGLGEAITRQTGVSLAGQADTGASAMELAAKVSPDLVVMDVHLPDMNGIEVTRRLLASMPSLKVMMFSSDGTRELVDEALQAGACGYLLKTTAVDELIHAVEAVMEGRLYLSPGVSEGILEDYRKGLMEESADVKPRLSAREKELLRLVAEGQRNKEIAEQLDISLKSVEAHRARLMKKLGYASTAELVRYAVREGIVPA
ncbi:MAG TPA: response regulator transcription factor [Verrucomicrobiae bacterium]|nr:response regulator transcription factor [Verrucomicrobiae bacterium]